MYCNTYSSVVKAANWKLVGAYPFYACSFLTFAGPFVDLFTILELRIS